MDNGDRVRHVDTDEEGTVLEFEPAQRGCDCGCGWFAEPARVWVQFAERREWLFARDVEEIIP